MKEKLVYIMPLISSAILVNSLKFFSKGMIIKEENIRNIHWKSF